MRVEHALMFTVILDFEDANKLVEDLEAMLKDYDNCDAAERLRSKLDDVLVDYR